MKEDSFLKPVDYIETLEQEIKLHVDERFHHLWDQVKGWAIAGAPCLHTELKITADGGTEVSGKCLDCGTVVVLNVVPNKQNVYHNEFKDA